MYLLLSVLGEFNILPTLFLDTAESWARMLIALVVSVLVSLAIGIYAARSERAGRIILPIVDILQTLPILAFFPLAIAVFVDYFPPQLGVNLAVIFLIMTSMLWNIIFGVYEAIKTLPKEIIEVSRIYRLGFFQRLRRIYIPAAMPKVVEQSSLSWAIGLFYLVTSEIFSDGGQSSYVVKGIGSELATLAAPPTNFAAYAIGLAVFIAFVIATKLLLFDYLGRRFSLERQFAQPAHPRQLAHRGMTHGARLAKEVSRLISQERKIVNPVPKRIARVLNIAHSGESAGAVARHAAQPGPAGRTNYLYYAVGVMAAIGVLYYAGVITPGVVYDEQIVLVALASTLLRVWFAFAAILVVSIPLCVYIVFFSKRTAKFTTVFQILASIPATIILPLLVLALANYNSNGEAVAFVVFFLSGVWYILFSVISMSKTMGEEIFEVKSIFSVKGIGAWKDIYLKAIAPGLITGAVTGIAAEWNASIVAEYFTGAGISGNQVLSSVGTGIGKLLDLSLSGGNLTLMYIALINLTVMIILVNTFVWKRLYRRMSEIYA